jgi:hypothetical protein
MTAQLTRTPDPLHKLRGDVPPALSALVARCLSKNAEDRPESAEAVLGELDAIQGALAADVHRSRSGETAARRSNISWPLALAATAVVVGGIWWSGRDPVTAPVVVPQAATPIVAGIDAEELDTLPPPSNRPLTRADSLAIAQALRDELDRLDPEGVTAPARPADVASIEATLARELARTDSIVRLRLIELTARRPDRSRPGLPSSAEGFSSLDQPRGDRSISVLRATPSAVRRVMVVAPPSRWRDSAARVASDTIVAELSRWLGRSEGWQVVPAAPRVEGEESPTDVLVTVGFTPVATDSAVLRILVRNMSAGSSFGYRSVASTPHPLPVEPRAFRGTVREALSVLEQLRRTPSGEPWTLDMGRP